MIAQAANRIANAARVQPVVSERFDTDRILQSIDTARLQNLHEIANIVPELRSQINNFENERIRFTSSTPLERMDYSTTPIQTDLSSFSTPIIAAIERLNTGITANTSLFATNEHLVQQYQQLESYLRQLNSTIGAQMDRQNFSSQAIKETMDAFTGKFDQIVNDFKKYSAQQGDLLLQQINNLVINPSITQNVNQTANVTLLQNNVTNIMNEFNTKILLINQVIQRNNDLYERQQQVIQRAIELNSPERIGDIIRNAVVTGRELEIARVRDDHPRDDRNEREPPPPSQALAVNATQNLGVYVNPTPPEMFTQFSSKVLEALQTALNANDFKVGEINVSGSNINITDSTVHVPQISSGAGSNYNNQELVEGLSHRFEQFFNVQDKIYAQNQAFIKATFDEQKRIFDDWLAKFNENAVTRLELAAKVPIEQLKQQLKEQLQINNEQLFKAISTNGGTAVALEFDKKLSSLVSRIDNLDGANKAEKANVIAAVNDLKNVVSQYSVNVDKNIDEFVSSTNSRIESTNNESSTRNSLILRSMENNLVSILMNYKDNESKALRELMLSNRDLISKFYQDFTENKSVKEKKDAYFQTLIEAQSRSVNKKDDDKDRDGISLTKDENEKLIKILEFFNKLPQDFKEMTTNITQAVAANTNNLIEAAKNSIVGEVQSSINQAVPGSILNPTVDFDDRNNIRYPSTAGISAEKTTTVISSNTAKVPVVLPNDLPKVPINEISKLATLSNTETRISNPALIKDINDFNPIDSLSKMKNMLIEGLFKRKNQLANKGKNYAQKNDLVLKALTESRPIELSWLSDLDLTGDLNTQIESYNKTISVLNSNVGNALKIELNTYKHSIVKLIGEPKDSSSDLYASLITDNLKRLLSQSFPSAVLSLNDIELSPATKLELSKRYPALSSLVTSIRTKIVLSDYSTPKDKKEFIESKKIWQNSFVASEDQDIFNKTAASVINKSPSVVCDSLLQLNKNTIVNPITNRTETSSEAQSAPQAVQQLGQDNGAYKDKINIPTVDSLRATYRDVITLISNKLKKGFINAQDYANTLVTIETILSSTFDSSDESFALLRTNFLVLNDEVQKSYQQYREAKLQNEYIDPESFAPTADSGPIGDNQEAGGEMSKINPDNVETARQVANTEREINIEKGVQKKEQDEKRVKKLLDSEKEKVVLTPNYDSTYASPINRPTQSIISSTADSEMTDSSITPSDSASQGGYQPKVKNYNAKKQLSIVDEGSSVISSQKDDDARSISVSERGNPKKVPAQPSISDANVPVRPSNNSGNAAQYASRPRGKSKNNRNRRPYNVPTSDELSRVQQGTKENMEGSGIKQREISKFSNINPHLAFTHELVGALNDHSKSKDEKVGKGIDSPKKMTCSLCNTSDDRSEFHRTKDGEILHESCFKAKGMTKKRKLFEHSYGDKIGEGVKDPKLKKMYESHKQAQLEEKMGSMKFNTSHEDMKKEVDETDNAFLIAAKKRYVAFGSYNEKMLKHLAMLTCFILNGESENLSSVPPWIKINFTVLKAKYLMNAKPKNHRKFHGEDFHCDNLTKTVQLIKSNPSIITNIEFY